MPVPCLNANAAAHLPCVPVSTCACVCIARWRRQGKGEKGVQKLPGPLQRVSRQLAFSSLPLPSFLWCTTLPEHLQPQRVDCPLTASIGHHFRS